MPSHLTCSALYTQEQAYLLDITGLNKRQLKNWFTNARRRIWKPLMLARQKGVSVDLEGQPPSLLGQPELLETTHTQTSAFSLSHAGPAVAPVAATVATSIRASCSSDALSQSSRHDTTAGYGFRNTEPDEYGGDGIIVMSLTEFENPSRVHTFEVPAVVYMEDGEDETNRNKNVIMDAVAVAANARCLMCTEDNVDVQAVPCQHLLHTRCLLKWMHAQTNDGSGAGVVSLCPICSIGITRVVLAIPCVSNGQQAPHRPRASTDVSVHVEHSKIGAVIGLPVEDGHVLSV